MTLSLITTVIIGIVGALLAAGMGAIGYFLKDIKSSLKEQQKENKEEIKVLRKDFEELKSEMPIKYVLRDDFIRAISNLENKMDRGFGELNKKLDKVFEIKTGGE